MAFFCSGPVASAAAERISAVPLRATASSHCLVSSHGIAVLTARIVSGALHIEDPRAQVADDVAAEDDHLLPAGGANCLVEIDQDLRIRLAAIVKRPARDGRERDHLGAPLPEQVIGAEVVLEHFIAPGTNRRQMAGDDCKRFGNGRVEGQVLGALDTRAEAPRGQKEGGVVFCRGLQRPLPDAGTAGRSAATRSASRRMASCELLP
jgi:hypothetical protein